MVQAASLPPDIFYTSGPAPAGLHLRLATPADEEALRRACYPQLSPSRFSTRFNLCQRRLASGRCFPLLALLGPEVVGSGQLVCYGHLAEIADLLVAPAWRDQGIGTALLQALIALAGHLQVVGLEIGVEVQNERARQLYRRLGFVPSRELRLPGQPATAIILRYPLLDKGG